MYFVRRGRRLDDPLFLPLTREVARRSRDGGRETKKISPPVKCVAFDSPLVRGGKNGGGKFSEFRHPFVCFADISPVRGNVCYNRVGRGLAPAAKCPFSEKIHARTKSHQNPRAGTETRPYNGSSRRRPLRTKYNAFDPHKPQFAVAQVRLTEWYDRSLSVQISNREDL